MQEYIDHIPHWLQIISFFILSMFKSYSGPSMSAIFNYSYSEMLIVNFSASIISILLTYRFRFFILNLFKRKDNSKNGYSKRLKNILIKWKKFGFFGVAIISPVLISIPVGVLISAHFKTSKLKIFTIMILSAFVWSNIFYFTVLYGETIFNYFMKVFYNIFNI